MLNIQDIIRIGQAVYESKLPAYAKTVTPSDSESPRPIITLSEEEQIQTCLHCSLPECVDLVDSRCPIRIRNRELWRKANHSRKGAR